MYGIEHEKNQFPGGTFQGHSDDQASLENIDCKWSPMRVVALVCLFVGSLVGCGGPGGDATPTANPVTGVNTATLSWDPPTTSLDGTALTDLAGFKVYFGTTSPVGTQSDQVLDVGNTTTYIVSDLAPGTYYFTVTAYDLAGNESTFASEVSKSIAQS